MIRPFRPLFLLPVVLLAACAQLSGPARPEVAPAPEARLDAADEARREREAEEARLPKLELTPPIVYGVLASEIGAQRGQVGNAAATYLDLARTTADPRLARRAAEMALFAGQVGVASDALALWIRLDPESHAAREQLFVVLLRAGKLAEGRPLIEEVLERDPARAPAVFVQLARLATRQADKPGTFALVRALSDRFPALPEARFALLSVAAEVDDQGTVAAEFDKLAKIAPKWDLPVAWQTDRLRRTDMDAALAFLKRELARRPDAGVELKMAYPRLLVSAKRYDEAREAFDALLARHPDDPELLYASGLMAYQLKDAAAAEKRLAEALKRGHAEADFLRLTLGQLAEQRGDAVLAQGYYESVVSGQNKLQAQVRLAALEAEAGRLEPALARLEAVDAASNDKIALAQSASQLARQYKRHDLAQGVLDRALAAYPNTPELLYERALVFELRGDYACAERDLRAFLVEKPGDAVGENALGYLLANRTQRFKEAQALIARALKADPDNPTILDSMGWVLYRRGQPRAALPFLERAWAGMKDAEIAAHLGEVLWQLGRVDDARALWDAGREVDAEHPVLLDTLKRFAR
ncbi:tetratricopeptide repeat protein [Crenobacter luteus]|uniref:tetratricopeptide repeat protein n=1 Tax=Crenobacter luteus TaxID=1452487 RepID=UPI0010464FEA|nr:tetratricopeptide repeat protein [Crenobacter luteus]TCP10940.1 tetratricopeptide repeat protein [Crenobacter luteus]